METEGEWAYVNKQIQKMKSPPGNEWHIGLMVIDGQWKWVSGVPLRINHWRPGQPASDGPYVAMGKKMSTGELGTFNDVPRWLPRGYICEKYVKQSSVHPNHNILSRNI